MIKTQLHRMTDPIVSWALQKYGAARYETSGDAHLWPLAIGLKKEKLKKFYKNGALEARLTQIDGDRPIKRLYIMGCGRSGTWLLTAVMSTFKGVCVVSKEVPIDFFGQLSTTGDALILKRNSDAYQHIEKISERIGLVYIVRHPFDVLTSNNPQTKREYHIEPHRWLGEMLALKFLIEAQRKNVQIVRYEDLVTDGSKVQQQLAAYFGFEIASHIDDLPAVFKASSAADAAMHGVRKIDTRSIGKYKRNPKKIDYLRSIRPRLGSMLDWVGSEFSYDISLK
jgi:hypothetical protein